jgi:site-specific DNA-adenine methylase
MSRKLGRKYVMCDCGGCIYLDEASVMEEIPMTELEKILNSFNELSDQVTRMQKELYDLRRSRISSDDLRKEFKAHKDAVEVDLKRFWDRLKDIREKVEGKL